MNTKPVAIIVPVSTFEKLINNLAQQPWVKVSQLIAELQTCEPYVAPPPEDAPPA
jgi:hypothetical protein